MFEKELKQVNELAKEIRKLNEHLSDIKKMVAPYLGWRIKNEKE